MSTQNESPILLPDNNLPKAGLELPPLPQNSAVTDKGVAVHSLPDDVTTTESGILKPKPEQPIIAIADPDSPLLQTEVTRPSIDREKLYFMARPLDYFESKLQQHHLSSPMQEIKTRVEIFENNLPQLTETEQALLNSPLPYVREAAISDLKKRNISAEEIQDFQRQGSAPHMVDVSTLKFSWPEKVTKLPSKFYAFLTEVIKDQLPDGEMISLETIKHLGRFFSHLEMVIEAFQYKHQVYKLSDNTFMDLIAQRLEAWANKLEPAKKQSPSLNALFNFLSHFDIGSSAALKIFQKILSVYGENHPLRQAIDFKLQKPQTVNVQPTTQFENVGIEIEGIPLVFVGHVPHGFMIGIDGGGNMPEIRRTDETIPFNLEYQKDLFEFWYWARMSRLQGISVHFHLDEVNDERYHIFNKFKKILLANDGYSLRPGDDTKEETVEIRFNLDSYRDNQHDDHQADLTKPFFGEQFNLILLIQELLRIKQADFNLVDRETLAEQNQAQLNPYLDNFWQLRFQKKDAAKNPEEIANELAQETDKNTELINNILAVVNNPVEADYSELEKLVNMISYQSMSEELLFLLGKKTRWDLNIIRTALQKLPVDKINSDYLFFRFGEAVDYNLALDLFVFLPAEAITPEFLEKLGEKTHWSTNLMSRALRKMFQKTIGPNLLLKICKNTNWDAKVLSDACNKLAPETMSLEVLNELGSKTGWANDTLIKVIENLPGGMITPKLFLEELVGKTRESEEILVKLIEKLTQSAITREFLETLTAEWAWDSALVKTAFSKLTDQNVILNTLMSLIKNREKLDLEPSYDVHELIQQLPDNIFDRPLFVKLGKKLKWNPMIIGILLRKTKKEIITKDFLAEIGEKVDWDESDLTDICEELPNECVDEQILLMFGEKTNWDARVIYQLIDHILPSTLTKKIVLMLGDKIKWEVDIIASVIEKMPDQSIDSQLFEKLCRKSQWEYQTISLALEKLQNHSMTPKLLEKLEQKSSLDADLLFAAIKKMPPQSFNLELFLWLAEKINWRFEHLGEISDKLQDNVPILKIIGNENLNRAEKVVAASMMMNGAKPWGPLHALIKENDDEGS